MHLKNDPANLTLLLDRNFEKVTTTFFQKENCPYMVVAMVETRFEEPVIHMYFGLLFSNN